MAKYLISLIIFGCILCGSAFSQTETSYDTVEKRIKKMSIGGYFVASGRKMPLQDGDIKVPGFHFGISVNEWFFFGAYGAYADTEANYRSSSEVDSLEHTLVLTQLGGEIGVNLWSRKIVHIHFAVFGGSGKINMRVADQAQTTPDNYQKYSKFSFVEPELQAEVNLTDFMRLGIGIGYQVVVGIDSEGLDDDALQGMVAAASLKFVYL